MKKLIILAVVSLSLTGCGIAEDIGRQCGGSFEHFCSLIFGSNSSDIEELDDRLTELEDAHKQAVTTINTLSQSSNSNEALLNTLQTQANSMQVQIAQLESYENIVELVDPCGPHAGYDEVLLKTSSGKFIAYFQSGNGNNQKRFLTELSENVLYSTTDTQLCQFSIINGVVNDN